MSVQKFPSASKNWHHLLSVTQLYHRWYSPERLCSWCNGTAVHSQKQCESDLQGWGKRNWNIVLSYLENTIHVHCNPCTMAFWHKHNIAQSGAQLCYELNMNTVHGGEECKRSNSVWFIQSDSCNPIPLRQRLKLRSDSLSLWGVKSRGKIILQAVGICNLFVEEDTVG